MQDRMRNHTQFITQSFEYIMIKFYHSSYRFQIEYFVSHRISDPAPLQQNRHVIKAMISVFTIARTERFRVAAHKDIDNKTG